MLVPNATINGILFLVYSQEKSGPAKRKAATPGSVVKRLWKGAYIKHQYIIQKERRNKIMQNLVFECHFPFLKDAVYAVYPSSGK